MTSRRQEKSAEIARSAVKPLSALGVHNVTLAELGAQLGMTGAHLLYYFKSKSDLFMAALRLVEQDLRDRIQEAFEDIVSARERWDLLLDIGAPTGLDDSGLLLWLEAWGEAVRDIEFHALISELEDNWQGLMRETLEYAVARGELPDTIDPTMLAEGVSALLDGLTIRVVVGYRPVDHDAALRIVHSFLAPQLQWREPTTVSEEK